MTKRPEFKLVGASCHSREELAHAIALELDFAVVGSVNASPTHDMQAGIGWQAFQGITADCPLPVFAIGGLQRNDQRTAWLSGAHGVAAIRGAWCFEQH